MPYPSVLPRVAASNVISIRDLRARCATCSMRELCLPTGLDADAMRELDLLVTTRRRFKKGESVFRSGDRFVALYAIRSGSCKTTVLTEDGREQVSGYHMPGEMMGFDGIGSDLHRCQAVALACTELPLALNEANCGVPVLDTTRLLAEAAVEYAAGTGPPRQPLRG